MTNNPVPLDSSADLQAENASVTQALAESMVADRSSMRTWLARGLAVAMFVGLFCLAVSIVGGLAR